MGNKVGWILAGVLLTALIGVIVYFVIFPSPSRPKDTLEEGMLEKQTIRFSLSTVVGSEPGGGGNAGDDYKKAADLAGAEDAKSAVWSDDKSAEEGAITRVHRLVWKARKQEEKASVAPDDVATLERIAAHVADGAGKKSMEYLFTHTPKSLSVKYSQDIGLSGLQAAASAVRVLGEYYVNQKQYDKALEAFKDLCVMGRHMADERSHLQLLQMGLATQRNAIVGMEDVYRAQGGHDADRQALREYESALTDIERYIHKKCRILFSHSPYAGDVFNIAEHDEDRAWRVQAVLTLGIVKFTARETKDVKYCTRLIGKLVEDSDPVIAAAANAAQKQTREQHRGLGANQ